MPRDPSTEPSLLLPAALLVAAVGLTWATSIPASFQFDDWNVIVDEPRVQTLRAFWASMPGIRPVLKLTYALNHESGLGVAGFRAANVAIHAANACLVLILFTILARRLGAGRDARSIGLVGAALFALHPVQTEAVTYVSGRSSSLAALFALGSLLAWIRGRERRSAWLLYGASPLLLLLALGTKETAFATPLAMLLWWRIDREHPGPSPPARSLRDLVLPFAIVLAAASGALALGTTYRRLLEVSLGARGTIANLATQSEGVLYLAGQIVRVDRLNADPWLPALAGFTPASAIAALVLLGALAAALACLRRLPALAFGVLWFFLWLLPTNSFVPRLDVVNDRQVYLALAGPAWMLSWCAFRFLGSRKALLGAAAVLCLSLAVLTVRRNAVYADEIVFWRDVVRKSPENGRARNNLGYAYALASRDREAEEAFLAALAIDGADVRAAVNLKLLRQGALPRTRP